MKRRLVQILAAVLTNHYVAGFFKATIYKGRLKNICHPGLQCYSCPSSNTACPLGALQNSLATVKESLVHGKLNIGFYVIGYLGLLGMLFGRLICGWVCPFGLLQELIYKIPSPKFRMPRIAARARYVLLAALVIALPLALSAANPVGATYPWYCKLVCPAGTLEAGLPKILLEPGIRDSLGFFFRLKWVILISFLFWMVVTYRAFCGAGCPLGAIYGLFNRWSLFRLHVDKEKCTRCKACERACPFGLHVYEQANHGDCIRCLKCIPACKFDALHSGWGKTPAAAAADAMPVEADRQ